jgi:4-carboxymuconolactone decarboxylase
MINLAMLTALNRGHEFGVHVRGALTNGVTPEEVRGSAQATVYCGAPAGSSVPHRRTVLTEQGVDVDALP